MWTHYLGGAQAERTVCPVGPWGDYELVDSNVTHFAGHRTSETGPWDVWTMTGAFKAVHCNGNQWKFIACRDGTIDIEILVSLAFGQSGLMAYINGVPVTLAGGAARITDYVSCGSFDVEECDVITLVRQVSADGGATWSDVYSSDGVGMISRVDSNTINLCGSCPCDNDCPAECAECYDNEDLPESVLLNASSFSIGNTTDGVATGPWSYYFYAEDFSFWWEIHCVDGVWTAYLYEPAGESGIVVATYTLAGPYPSPGCAPIGTWTRVSGLTGTLVTS